MASSYWDIQELPLLLQGFDRQSVTLPLIFEDSKSFNTEVNRGVITALDYSSVNLQLLLGLDEAFWNDAKITLRGGGQDLLQNVPAEMFDYMVDLGNQQEQKIWTWIEGGQTLESSLKVDAASASTALNIQTTLHAYYMTKRVHEWRQKIKWKSGLGMKRRAYNVQQAAAAGTYTVEDTLPVNQGAIIGFSIVYLGANSSDALLDLAIDGLKIVKNAKGERFSRMNQRDPFVFLVPLNPGSKFTFDVRQTSAAPGPGSIFLTFYFDN